MLDDQTKLSTDLLASIHAQLEPREAGELTYYASDDPVMFCATVLAKVSSGQLKVRPEELAFLSRGLRESEPI
jgi:hypothetical protein